MGVQQAIAVEEFQPQPLTAVEKNVLEFIERAAMQERELEGNDEIGAILGFNPQAGGIRAVIRRLERKGVVKVRSFQRGRSIFAVRVGKWTKPPLCTVPHWRSIERTSRDTTPTQPVYALIETPQIMDEVQRLMRERSLTMPQAQIVLMSYGVSMLAAEQAMASTAYEGAGDGQG